MTPAPDGTVVTFSLLDNAAGASFVNGSTCSTSGGSCSIQINSTSAGRVVIHATATYAVAGLSITRSTSTIGNGDDVEKIYVIGSVSWLKTDDTGQPLGGAGFRLCQTHAYNSDTGSFVDITDVCVNVDDGGTLDANPASGQLKVVNLVLGRYTVEEVFAPVGYSIDATVHSVDITTAAPDGNAGTFVDPLVPLIEVLPFHEVRPAPPPPSQGPELAVLPVTGAPITRMMTTGLALLGLGLVLLLVGRTRRREALQGR